MSGLGVNAFQAPQPFKGKKGVKLIQFSTGQPKGCYSSWPLFALCHHILLWLAADRVSPGFRFRFQGYALLGDDIVIADKYVAE